MAVLVQARWGTQPRAHVGATDLGHVGVETCQGWAERNLGMLPTLQDPHNSKRGHYYGEGRPQSWLRSSPFPGSQNDQEEPGSVLARENPWSSLCSVPCGFQLPSPEPFQAPKVRAGCLHQHCKASNPARASALRTETFAEQRGPNRDMKFPLPW